MRHDPLCKIFMSLYQNKNLQKRYKIMIQKENLQKKPVLSESKSDDDLALWHLHHAMSAAENDQEGHNAPTEVAGSVLYPSLPKNQRGIPTHPPK